MSIRPNLLVGFVLTTLVYITQVSATELHLAVAELEIDRARALMTPAQSINEADAAGMTPLHYAVLKGRADMVNLLLNGGADPGIPVKSSAANISHYISLNKFSPLHIAANRDAIEIAVLLIARGASINRATDDQRSALHIAAMKGNARLAQVLIDHGADVNARDFEEYSPLFSAACYGRLDVVELLLANGADITASGADGRTAYECALDRNQQNIVSYLQQIGISA